MGKATLKFKIFRQSEPHLRTQHHKTWQGYVPDIMAVPT